ncbi:hypothetical protein HDV06_000762 [Boothiomyces sp. JEL0866]|nr:hypothetical protein HDV06_000762 [Boothiomyces sp. JEL0866]
MKSLFKCQPNNKNLMIFTLISLVYSQNCGPAANNAVCSSQYGVKFVCNQPYQSSNLAYCQQYFPDGYYAQVSNGCLPDFSNGLCEGSTQNTSTATPQEQTGSSITIVGSAPSSNAQTNCAAEWNQCGGSGWSGSNCCQSGLICQAFASTFSMCIQGVGASQSGSTSSTTSSQPNGSTQSGTNSGNPPAQTTVAPQPSTQGNSNVPSSVNCANEWAQCGGTGFTGTTCCGAGLSCVKENDNWSSCQKSSANSSPQPSTTTVQPSGSNQTGGSTVPQVTITTTSAPATSTTSTGNLPAYSGSLPSKFFAPFVDATVRTLSPSDIQSVGTSWFMMAFIVQGSQNTASWGGIIDLSPSVAGIQQMKQSGANFGISFGGQAGQELAVAISDVTTLQKQYQTVIDTYGINWIDFDIEGDQLPNTAANTRRAQAIAAIQKANPGITVSFTLPVLQSGLTGDGTNFLAALKSNGVRLDILNVMAMDYGGAVSEMGQAAISATKATYTQAQQAGFPNVKMGITPMIGNNDSAGETFTVAHAQEVVQFAQQTSYVQWVSFWSLQRDTATSGPLYASSQISQTNFQFSNTFSKV